MKLSPLQLKYYHFTEVSVTSRQGIDLEDVTKSDAIYPEIDDSVDFHVDIHMGGNETMEDFTLRLKVTGDPKEDSNFPYRFSMVAEAVFHYTGQEAPEERKPIVVCNGAGVLYGVIRDQLMTLTARLSHGPILLPTLDFRRLKEEPLQSDAQG